MRRWVLWLSLVASVGTVGCGALPGIPKIPAMPSVHVTDLRLVRAPSAAALAAYACPALAERGGVPGGPLACELALGPKPALDALDLIFDLPIDAGNTEDFAVPAPALALALDLWPDDASARTTGTACAQFCAEGDATCSSVALGACAPAPTPDAPHVVEDLFALATSKDLAEAAENLGVRVIPPHSQVTLDVYFRIAPERVVEALRPLAEQVAQQALHGESIAPSVPYEAAGTLFVDVPFAGRQGLDFGPAQGDWTLPLP